MTRRGVIPCPIAGLDLTDVGPNQHLFDCPSLEHGSGHISRAMCHAYALCDAYDAQGNGWMTTWLVLYSSKLGFRHIGYNIWGFPDERLDVYKAAGATETHFELARQAVRVLLNRSFDTDYAGLIAQIVSDSVELDAWSQNRKPAWMTFYLAYSTALLPQARILYEQTRTFASFADIWPIARTMTLGLWRSFDGCEGGTRTRPTHDLVRTRG